MVVFGLASTVKATFGDDVSFVVVTKMAFILNFFALVLLSGHYRMMMRCLFPFGHDHRVRLHASGCRHSSRCHRSSSCLVILMKALVQYTACDEVRVDESEAGVDVGEVDDEAP
jgi:hypothetical protein